MSTHKRMRAVDPLTNPVDGVVCWKGSKSLWYCAARVATVVLAPLTISPGAVLVSFSLTITTLCLGHTIGMHRRLIHESFACPRWLEYLLVYLGVLVGIAGPLRIIYLHDIREWSQRLRSRGPPRPPPQPRCRRATNKSSKRRRSIARMTFTSGSPRPGPPPEGQLSVAP